jgi:hypothetical protein
MIVTRLLDSGPGYGDLGDGGARERLRMVTQMIVTRELDSGPGYGDLGDGGVCERLWMVT